MSGRFSSILLIILIYSYQLFSQDKKYELVSINFEGNNNFSDSELKEVIQSRENPWWFYRFLNSFTPLGSPSEYFDSTSIQVDLISIRSFYSVNGFFETKAGYNFVLDSIDKTAELNFQIKENDYCTYGKINLHGLDSLSELDMNLITADLTFTENKRYEQSIMEEKLSKVMHTLKNVGYMLAEFDSSLIDIDTIANKANMNFYFNLGSYFTYNEIKVEKSGEGQNLVSDELIKYIAGISIGDPYREDVLASSRLRLARTGLFNSVNVKGERENRTYKKVPLLITCNIGSMYELSPEVFGDNELNTFNAGIGASFIKKNFYGDARKLTARSRLRVNDITQIFNSTKNIQTEIDLSMILEQPYLFSKRLSGRLETYFKSYNIQEVDYKNYGAVFSSSVEMPTYTFINLLNPYIRVDNLDWEIPYKVENTSYLVTAKTLTSSLGSEVGSNNVDDIFFPRDGYTSSMIAEISTSDVVWNVPAQLPNLTKIDELGYYYKVQIDFNYFFPVSKDRNTVLGLKFKSGYIQMIKGGQQLIAPNQTFFAGGSNSVRGWRARDLVPINTINYVGANEINQEQSLRGGTFLTEGSVEYRRRFEENYGFAVFFDYGNSWNGYREARIDQVAAAIGFGLRYYSSIAPFRLDFGLKFYDPYDQKYIFDKSVTRSLSIHFGIGEAF